MVVRWFFVFRKGRRKEGQGQEDICVCCVLLHGLCLFVSFCIFQMNMDREGGGGRKGLEAVCMVVARALPAGRDPSFSPLPAYRPMHCLPQSRLLAFFCLPLPCHHTQHYPSNTVPSYLLSHKENMLAPPAAPPYHPVYSTNSACIVCLALPNT